MEIKTIQQNPIPHPPTFGNKKTGVTFSRESLLPEIKFLERKLGLFRALQPQKPLSPLAPAPKPSFPVGDHMQQTFLEQNVHTDSLIKKILDFFKRQKQNRYPMGDRLQREFLEHS